MAPVITGIFAILIGLGSVWFSVKFLKLYFKVKGWNRVNARVISKTVSIHEKFLTTRTPYKLKASYTYILDGKEYTGNKVYLAELLGGQANHMKKDADRRLDQIKGIMPVYVDPKDPKTSVMYCDGAVLYCVTLAIGLFALVFGITQLV
jgi:hypothetical protein